MANTHIQRTTGSGDNRRKFTYSFWVKLADLTGENKVFIYGTSGTEGGININYPNDGKWNFYDYQSNGYTYQLVPNRLFRDTNGYYHVTVAVDTTQATSSNRVKIWINGVQETSFATETYPSQNAEMACNNSNLFSLGNCPTQSNYFSGIVSHVHFSDGYAYQASDFGSTDATTGEWQINTSPNISYGSQGFFILKDGNSLTDQSPNSNDFSTVSGTLTKSEDNPSNVFATFNPLIGLHSNGGTLVPNLEAGNTDAWYNSTQWRIAQSTLATSSGKYYAEFKQSNDYGTDYAYIGIWDIDAYAQKITGYPLLSDMANCFGFRNDTGDVYASGSASSYGSSWTTNDIIGIALDCDNNKLYFSKNGTWQNSANPSNGTGGVSITADKTYAMGLHLYNSAYRVNFGNGYFGTTAVSSAGTNASGIGIFEYDVPTGYTALSTKGLNE